ERAAGQRVRRKHIDDREENGHGRIRVTGCPLLDLAGRAAEECGQLLGSAGNLDRPRQGTGVDARRFAIPGLSEYDGHDEYTRRNADRTVAGGACQCLADTTGRSNPARRRSRMASPPKEIPMTAIRIAALAFLAAATPLQARVVSFEIEKQAPYGRFNGVDFNRIEAKVRGELTSADRIPDVEKVAGKAIYETRVLLIAPATRANGALLLEVHNRGRVISHALYNGPREPVLGVGSIEPGTGFLQRQGFALASVTWEYGEGIAVPKFRD